MFFHLFKKAAVMLKKPFQSLSPTIAHRLSTVVRRNFQWGTAYH